MFTRIVRNFAKIRVPRDFSGELELRKNNWEMIIKGDPIAYIGSQPLKAEANGIIIKPLSRQGSSVSEGAEIYRFFDFMFWLKVILPIYLSPFVAHYIDRKNLADKEKQLELEEEEIRIQRMKREVKELELRIKKRGIKLKDHNFPEAQGINKIII